MAFNHVNKAATLIIIFSFVIQACTSVNSSQISQDDNDDYSHLMSSKNKLLLTRVSIAEIKAANAGDLMRTNIVLHNRWHISVQFSYQVRWYDENDFEIDPGSHPWTPVTLNGKDDITVQSTAPRSSATQFKIFIKD